jgi:butyrate kinase
MVLKYFAVIFSGTRGGRKMSFVILSIYPMALSARLALFEDDAEIKRTELPLGQSVSETEHTGGQPFADAAAEWLAETKPPDAVITGVALSSRMPSGLYIIGDDFKTCPRDIGRGATLALESARRFSALPLALVSLSNREVDAIYKISGIRGMSFKGLSRIIRIRDAIRVVSGQMGMPPEKCSVVAAYLGNGFSICSQSEGRVRDFTDSYERGAFSVRHAGSLSATAIVRMAYSGVWSKADLLKNVYESGGLSSYFPDAGLNEVVSMMRDGDVYASTIMKAMINQLAGEFSAHVSALYGRVDAFVLLGYLAANEFFVSLLKDKISWVCDKIIIHKGGDELSILAGAALRHLRGGGTPALPEYSEG